MKNSFIKYLIVIGCFAIVISYSVFLFVNYGLRKQKNDTFPELKELLSGNKNFQILFIGSSLAKNNFNPMVFDSLSNQNSYNFGYPSAKISHNYMIINRYLHSNHPSPEKILLVLEPWILDSTVEINFPVQYYPYYKDTMIFNYVSKYDNDIKAIRDFPFIGITKYNDYMKFLGITGVFFPNRTTSILIKGYEPLDEKSWRENGVQMENKLYKVLPKSSRNSGIRFLDNICKLCEEKHIQLYFVFPPTYHLKSSKTNYDIKTFMNELHPILSKYSIKCIDGTNLDLCQKKYLFFDGHHLNKNGAAIYSKIIAESLFN